MNEITIGQPLVSAIIATYNRAHIVCEAIDSILHQSYQNIELIVIDDGSTDQTQEILNSYGAKVRVVYQKNSGPAAAWNRGIKESRGEIIAFLGSDDIWLPTFIERQVSVLRRAAANVPCSLSNSWLGFATGNGTTSFQNTHLQPAFEEGIWSNPAEVFLTRFVLFGQSVAIRRSAIEEVGLFDETLWYLEDLDFALKLAVGKSWGFIREPLVVWRQSTGESLSQKGMNKCRAEMVTNRIKIFERILPSVSRANDLAGVRRILKRELSQSYTELTAERLAENNRWAARAIAKSIRFAQKCQGYMYRRSSSYPQMEIARFDQLPADKKDPAASVLVTPSA
jgi:glycosyltransferase involved in cell wall biosynthesis